MADLGSLQCVGLYPGADPGSVQWISLYPGADPGSVQWVNLYPGADQSAPQKRGIDEFQINVDLRTSGFDNEVLSVDACAV